MAQWNLESFERAEKVSCCKVASPGLSCRVLEIFLGFSLKKPRWNLYFSLYFSLDYIYFIAQKEYISPVSSLFHTEVTVSIGLKTKTKNGEW